MRDELFNKKSTSEAVYEAGKSLREEIEKNGISEGTLKHIKSLITIHGNETLNNFLEGFLKK